MTSRPRQLLQRFHNTVSTDTRKIRARHIEAIRAGANNADASAYANGKIDKIIKPQPMVAPKEERDRLMPEAWTSPAPAPAPQEYESPDKTEVRKRVVLQPGAFEAKPTPEPAVVQTSAEIASVAVKLDEVLTPPKPVIPPDFDRPAFPWPQLRSLATSMGCSANGRADAVASIKAKLIADAQPIEEAPAPADPVTT